MWWGEANTGQAGEILSWIKIPSGDLTWARFSPGGDLALDRFSPEGISDGGNTDFYTDQYDRP